MGGYIKFDKDLHDDPRLLNVAAKLRANLDVTCTGQPWGDAETIDLIYNALLGGMSLLWTYGDIHILTGDILPIPYTVLPKIMRLPLWIIDLVPREWIRDMGDGTVTLPMYCNKNNVTPRDKRKAKQVAMREKWREKKSRQRSKKRKGDSKGDMPGDIARDMPGDTREYLVPGTGTLSPIPGPVPKTATATNGASPAPAPHAAATAPRKSFDEEFRQRFGYTPDRASAMRSKPDRWKG